MPTNIGNPTEMTIMQFAEVIRDLVGKQVKIIHKDLPEDDPKQRKPDISKAVRLLKWRPVVSLEEGLSKTIDYFRNLPDTKADRVERRGVLSLVRKRIRSR
jgi:dTDP-glucose 4,6-dehydratase